MKPHEPTPLPFTNAYDHDDGARRLERIVSYADHGRRGLLELHARQMTSAEQQAEQRKKRDR